MHPCKTLETQNRLIFREIPFYLDNRDGELFFFYNRMEVLLLFRVLKELFDFQLDKIAKNR